MTLSKKDYAQIAVVIASEPPMIRARLGVKLGVCFARDNPRFRADAWADALELSEKVAAEVVEKIKCLS